MRGNADNFIKKQFSHELSVCALFSGKKIEKSCARVCPVHHVPLLN